MAINDSTNTLEWKIWPIKEHAMQITLRVNLYDEKKNSSRQKPTDIPFKQIWITSVNFKLRCFDYAMFRKKTRKILEAV